MSDSEKELEVSKEKLSKDEEPKKERCKKEKKVSWRKSLHTGEDYHISKKLVGGRAWVRIPLESLNGCTIIYS